ncbi:MAG: hypothetical protein ACFFBH_16915 [Promethearchaeota archaeon]
MFKEILYSNYPIRYKKLKKFLNFKFPLFWVTFDLLLIISLSPLYELKFLGDYLITILVSFISLTPILLWCVLFRIYAHFDYQITKNERKYQGRFYRKYLSNFDYYKSYCRVCGQELSAQLFKASKSSYIKPIKIGASDYKNYYCKQCFKKFSFYQFNYTIIITLVSIIPIGIFFTLIFKKINAITSIIGLFNISIGILMLIVFLLFVIIHYIQGLNRYR